jgi:hypothetical protein
MGSAPCHAWTITKENVAKLCPKEFAALDIAIDDWDSFAQAIEVEDQEVLTKKRLAKWETLQEAFEKATQTDSDHRHDHLELSIGFYDPDSGDRYDELEAGCFFMVEGVTVLSPPGEKFKDILTEQSWTVFG